MTVRTEQRQAVQRQERSFLLGLVLLALFFSAGIVLGQVLSERVPAGTGEELERYLTGYFSLSRDRSPDRKVLLSTLLIYFRYPVLAFLLGFASAGVVLLPVVTGAYGCFLSFSVCCFTASFGGGGVLLALAVFGLRCFVTLPCYFALAVPSVQNAAALATLSFGRSGRRTQPVRYGSEWWLRSGIAAGILLAGVLLDLFLSPALLELVLEHILT